MKNLVRGGAMLSLLSLFVVIIYAQTKTEPTLAIANDSQAKIENNISDNNLITDSHDTDTANADTVNTEDAINLVNLDDTDDDKKSVKTDDTDSDKKLVKTTGSVRAVGAGASRGAFSASAYCFTGRTATGQGVRRGIIAADPRVLKLGSRVYVEAGPWSGTYLVADVGGGIKGKKIDIWVPGCSEARKFGRRSVQVFSVQ